MTLSLTATGSYLEHRAGTHFKFYTVIQISSTVIKHWGRIGTNGQIKMEQHNNPQLARSEAARTVHGKLSKGYTARHEGVEFTVYDDDLEGAINRDDPRRFVTLFDQALRDPKFTGEKDSIVEAYAHLLKKLQGLMDRAATQPFESVFNDFEELRAVFGEVEDQHSLAQETVKMTEQMLAQAMVKGSFS